MVQKIDIVLAAPGDADSARMVVEAVVDHLNLGVARNAGVRLDLTLLDDGGLPDSSAGGAAIFVGALWTTFSKSGLDEARAARVRFFAAYEKFLVDPSTIRMLVFVNDEAVPPSRIDPDQFALVREFQTRVKADGLRPYIYDGREDLRVLLESKLERLLLDLPPLTEKAAAQTTAPTESTPESPADVINIEDRPKKPVTAEPTFEQKLRPPTLPPAANDDRFVLAALAPLTPELLETIDRKAWDMIQSFEVIGDVIGFMATDARHHLQTRKPETESDPQMGLIFNVMSRKEEDELSAFADTAEKKIAMLKEIYQTVLNAMRHEYYRRKPELEASGYNEDTLDTTFRAVAKFSGPLKAAAPHLQAFRSRVSGLKRTTAEFHKAKLQVLEFLDRYLAELAALRNMLARTVTPEMSSRL
jgi:hypothetical protein